MAKKVDISYEGMGTCVEATVKVNGRYICTVTSNSIKTNEQTKDIIQAIERHLTNGDELSDDLTMALTIGPMNELRKRLNEVFKKHFSKSFKAR